MSGRGLQLALATLLALGSSSAYAAPDEGGGEEAGLRVVLKNGKDAEGNPKGCYFEVAGRTPPLMDGTRLRVTLQARGRSRDFPVKILRAVVKQNTYTVSYPWPDRVFAPLPYEVKVELLVGKQAKSVQKWIMTEYGYAQTHQEVIDRRVVLVGSEEERTEFAIQNIENIKGFVQRLDGSRLTIADFAKTTVDETEGGRQRHQELTMGLILYRNSVDEYFRQYVVLLEAGFHQTILRHLRTLTRILRDLGRARAPKVLPKLAARLEQLGTELDASVELIKQYAPVPDDGTLVPEEEEEEEESPPKNEGND